MSGHVAQVARPVHDEGCSSRRATLPGVILFIKDCGGLDDGDDGDVLDDDCDVLDDDQSPGDATTC